VQPCTCTAVGVNIKSIDVVQEMKEAQYHPHACSPYPFNPWPGLQQHPGHLVCFGVAGALTARRYTAIRPHWGVLIWEYNYCLETPEER